MDMREKAKAAALEAGRPKKKKNIIADREKNPQEETTPEEATGFDYTLLPRSVAPYVHDVADRMDRAPVSFAGVSALAVLSAAIGRRVGVRPKLRDDWTVIPNLWGMIVAPPSVKKTPIYSEMMGPLNKAEAEEHEIFKAAMKDYELEMIDYEIAMRDYKAKRSSGDGSPTPPVAPEKPIRKRYLINDATTERVAEIMIDNPLGLLVTVDELSGFFASLSKAGREGDMAFWLEAFNGGGGKNIDRIGRGSLYVPHVCASIFGTTQPDTIMNMVAKTTGGGSGGNGLLQRFQLLAFESSTIFQPTDRTPNYVAKEEYERTVLELLSSSPESYGAKRDRYKEELLFYRFSSEANDVFRGWNVSLHQRIREEEETNPALAAHLGKFPGLFASLSLILFYVDRINGETSADEIPGAYAERSAALCDFFEGQARQLYDIERIKERRREELDEKILKKTKELHASKKLPMSFATISQKVRGAKAKDVRRALKGVAEVKGAKVISLMSNV
jgi:putative DNA primase/helicase